MIAKNYSSIILSRLPCKDIHFNGAYTRLVPLQANVTVKPMTENVIITLEMAFFRGWYIQTH